MKHVRIDWRPCRKAQMAYYFPLIENSGVGALTQGKLWLPLQLADDSVNVRVMHERSLKLWNNSTRMLRGARNTCASQRNAGRHWRGAP